MGAEVGSELSLALLTTIREAVASRVGSAASSNVCLLPPCARGWLSLCVLWLLHSSGCPLGALMMSKVGCGSILLLYTTQRLDFCVYSKRRLLMSCSCCTALEALLVLPGKVNTVTAGVR